MFSRRPCGDQRRAEQEGAAEETKMTWRELADENRTAAYDLFASGRWRSCVSRAYYALYAEATHALLDAGVAMPAGQSNPKHKGLSNLVLNSLPLLSWQKRGWLFEVVRKLYDFRISADYRPTVILEKEEARICLGLMTQGLRILKEAP